MPESAQVRYALASAEESAAAGNFLEAGERLREAVTIQEAQLGADHPDLASTLNNLGVVCERTGEIAEAERCYRRAYAIVRAALAPDDPLVATSRQNLTDFCAARGIPVEPPAPPTPPPVLPAPSAEPARPAPPVVAPRRPVRPSTGRLVPLAVAGVVVVVILTRLMTRSEPAVTPPPSETATPVSTSAPVRTPAPPAVQSPATSPASSPATPQPSAPHPAAAKSISAGIVVADAQLCRALATGAEWKCTPAGDAIAPGVIYFYTRVTSPREATVIHRWYRDNRVQQTRELQISANPGAGYRTYSRITIDAGGAGQWRVELTTSDGRVLREARFVVR